MILDYEISEGDSTFSQFRAQKELVEKERKEEEEARKKRLGHADEVRTQIREKEHARIAERNAFFEEGVKLDEEARQRRAKLEEVKRKKLETLRWVIYLFYKSSMVQLLKTNAMVNNSFLANSLC